MVKAVMTRSQVLVEYDKLYGGDGNHQLACDEGLDLYSEISSLNNLLLRLKCP